MTQRLPPAARAAALVLALAALIGVVAAALDPGFRAGPATTSGASLVQTAHGFGGALASSALVLLITLLLGVPLGLVAGYLSPLADGVLARLAELAGAWPTLVVIAVAWSARGATDLATFVLVLGALRAIRVARVVRSEVLRVGGQEFVLAARALGVGPSRVLGAHVLPHVLAPALVCASFSAAAVVGLEAALGYLGFELPGTLPSWGALIAGSGGPVVVIWPTLAIRLVTGSLYLVADALDNALSARQRLRRAPGGL